MREDLIEPARTLVNGARLHSEREPDLYRQAVRGKQELVQFFHDELGWHVDVIESAQQVRLHKRRRDVPDDRGPRLRRDSRGGPLAPTQVLVLVALICEQLWRRPQMTLNDLLQGVAQVCAAESEKGTLPRFRVVAGDGIGKQEARANRQSLVDALRLLEAEGTVSVDAELERAVLDEDTDLVVYANQQRLASKFSSLSPGLLHLDDLPPHQHVRVLSSDILTRETVGAGGSCPEADQQDRGPDCVSSSHDLHQAAPASVDERRLTAIRHLVDDPGTDPSDPSVNISYLNTNVGRERALNVLASIGLATTVRRDWWETTDPTGNTTGLDFPNGRRTERQAALALLGHLGDRTGDITHLDVPEVVSLLQTIQTDLPRWAAGYRTSLWSLARAAVAELVSVGLLTATSTADTWQVTPAVHLWRVRVHTNPAPGKAAAAEQTSLDL